MRRPMLNNSKAGDAVYDPFLGSGTTLIAAESIGRVCLAIEINPLYVDVAVRRWQAFTGKQATLQGDGRSFEAVAAERLANRGRGRPDPAPRDNQAAKEARSNPSTRRGASRQRRMHHTAKGST